ncbi:MAG: P13 family porin [Treponema sp.]|nr:P13 family porin [Treponema sp.]
MRHGVPESNCDFLVGIFVGFSAFGQNTYKPDVETVKQFERARRTVPWAVTLNMFGFGIGSFVQGDKRGATPQIVLSTVGYAFLIPGILILHGAPQSKDGQKALLAGNVAIGIGSAVMGVNELIGAIRPVMYQFNPDFNAFYDVNNHFGWPGQAPALNSVPTNNAAVVSPVTNQAPIANSQISTPAQNAQPQTAIPQLADGDQAPVFDKPHSIVIDVWKYGKNYWDHLIAKSVIYNQTQPLTFIFYGYANNKWISLGKVLLNDNGSLARFQVGVVDSGNYFSLHNFRWFAIQPQEDVTPTVGISIENNDITFTFQ